MKKIYGLFVILSIILGNSCKKEDNVGDGVPQKNDCPIILYDTVRQDTVFTTGYLHVSESVPDSVTCYMNMVLGNKIFYMSDYFPGFYLDLNNLGLKPGVYNVTFELLGKFSKNPSAIKQSICKKNAVIIYTGTMNNFEPDVSFSCSDEVLQGKLTLSDSLSEIQGIIVKKKIGSNPYYLIQEISGTNPFIFKDTTYVGEQAEYELTLLIKFPGLNFPVPYATGEVTKPIENKPVSVTVNNDGLPVLSWDKCPYYKNCIGYRVYNSFQGKKMLLQEVFGNDSTTQTITNISFPEESNLIVVRVPVYTPSYLNENLIFAQFSGSVPVTPGASIGAFSDIYTPVGPDYYIRRAGQFTGYSVANSSVTHQITLPQNVYTMSVSANDKYILYYTYENEYCFYLYTVATKVLERITFPYPDITSVTDACVADNGIAIIANYWGNYFVYDFVNKSLIQAWTGHTSQCTISPDGKTFSVGQLKFYQFSNGTYTEKENTPEGRFLGYLPWDASALIFLNNKSLIIRSVNDWSVIRTINANFVGFNNFDFNFRRMMGFSEGYKVSIVNFDSGLPEKEFYSNTEFNTPFFKLEGNNVYYSPDGRRIKMLNH